MPILIPRSHPTIDRDKNPIRLAVLLHNLYKKAAGANPTEVSTETSGDAVVQAYRLSEATVLYVKTTFDQSSPFQELWYEEYSSVIQVHLHDLVMHSEDIEKIWRQRLQSSLTAQMFCATVTELLLRLALLAVKSQHEKLHAVRSILA